MLQHFASPDELRETEHLVYAVRECVSATSLTRTWQEDLASPVGARDPSLRWLTRVYCATRLLRRGLTGPGFYAIDACCGEYAAIQARGHPGLLPALLNAVVCLEAVDPALGRSFLTYAHNLGEAIFPARHPVREMARVFARAGVAGLRARVRLLLEAYKAAVQGSVGRHRGPVGRDISVHLLAYQGIAELTEDIAHGRHQMDAALDQWSRWIKVSLDACDPRFLPMVAAFEKLIAMAPEVEEVEEVGEVEEEEGMSEETSTSKQQRQQQPRNQPSKKAKPKPKKIKPKQQPRPEREKLTREQAVQQWETLVEQVALCRI